MMLLKRGRIFRRIEIQVASIMMRFQSIRTSLVQTAGHLKPCVDLLCSPVNDENVAH